MHVQHVRHDTNAPARGALHLPNAACPLLLGSRARRRARGAQGAMAALTVAMGLRNLAGQNSFSSSMIMINLVAPGHCMGAVNGAPRRPRAPRAPRQHPALLSCTQAAVYAAAASEEVELVGRTGLGLGVGRLHFRVDATASQMESRGPHACSWPTDCKSAPATRCCVITAP